MMRRRRRVPVLSFHLTICVRALKAGRWSSGWEPDAEDRCCGMADDGDVPVGGVCQAPGERQAEPGAVVTVVGFASKTGLEDAFLESVGDPWAVVGDVDDDAVLSP